MADALFIYGGLALALALGVVIGVIGFRGWVRIQRVEQVIWHEKRARREARRLDKHELRKGKALINIIALQTAEQQAISNTFKNMRRIREGDPHETASSDLIPDSEQAEAAKN